MRAFPCCSRAVRPARTAAVKAYAQAERRVVRLTVAGPPDGQPPRTIEVEDPLSTPAELISVRDSVHLQTAGITKSEAREQAAIIQAQREEISTLRSALAETQDVMYKGKATYNDVVQTKDMQIAQLYELAASGVKERAKLRQELSEMQAEMQGTKRQLHAFMASLMQLKNSMDTAGDGDMEHALELLQSSSWTQSMQAAAAAGAAMSDDEDLYMQLVQMQQLSNTLVQDMRQDEALMQQGLEPHSKPGSSYSSSSSLDSFDSLGSPPAAASSSSSSISGNSTGQSASASSIADQAAAAKAAKQAAAAKQVAAAKQAAAAAAAAVTGVPAAKGLKWGGNGSATAPGPGTNSNGNGNIKWQ